MTSLEVSLRIKGQGNKGNYLKDKPHIKNLKDLFINREPFTVQGTDPLQS